MRIAVGRVIGVVGLASYNWWVGVVVGGHILTSPNELMSDLEVAGRPHAAVLSRFDVAAGLLLVVALALRGRRGPSGVRPEWWLLLVFAVAAAVGGHFPYLCPEGASPTCRAAEWHFQLPWRHYVHIAAGVAEFTGASSAILVAWRRTAGQRDAVGWIVKGTGIALLVAYPLIAAAYLTDRLGAVVEPIFFVCFSVIVAVELFEPAAERGVTRQRDPGV